MKSKIYIILGILLLITTFLIYRNFYFAKAANGISIKIYALSSPNDQGIEIENAISDDIYKTNIKSTVASGTLFRIKLVGGSGGNLSLTINQYSTSGNCAQIGGYVSSTDCIIEGVFTNPGATPQRVTITYTKGSQSASTSFFVVPTSNRGWYYKLEPESTSTQPTSTITYTIYSNKAYCPSNLPVQADPSISPYSTGFTLFPSIRSDDFINNINNIFVTKTLSLNGVPTGTYSLYLKSNTQQLSNTSTITVSPPLRLRCFIGFCQYYDETRNRWVNTSTSVCLSQGLQCEPGQIRE